MKYIYRGCTFIRGFLLRWQCHDTIGNLHLPLIHCIGDPMVRQSKEAVACSCLEEAAGQFLPAGSGIELGQVEIDELDIVHCQE